MHFLINNIKTIPTYYIPLISLYPLNFNSNTNSNFFIKKMALNKRIGKTKHMKDMEEFEEKKKIRRETDDVLYLIDEKKIEIQKQRNEIATLFLKSNNKEVELKKYIAGINYKMYSSRIAIDSSIERSSEDIIKAVGEIQVKIKKAIEYTKKEMEQEIADRFTQAELKQQERMNDKIREQKEIYEKMNEARIELNQIKQQFEETNIECDKLAKQNDHLRIAYDTVKSDNDNLKKKLIEIESENEKITKDYNDLYKGDNKPKDKEVKDLVKGKGKTQTNKSVNEEEDNKEEYVIENESSYDEEDNSRESKERSVRDDKEKEENKHEESPMNNVDPLIIIQLLKENIKRSRREVNEIFAKCSDLQKEKNEAAQLLQKCIDDLNMEINSLPSIKNSPYDIEHNRDINILDQKIRILTYIYDNALQASRTKKLVIPNNKPPRRSLPK